jgi:hypothetical protein
MLAPDSALEGASPEDASVWYWSNLSLQDCLQDCPCLSFLASLARARQALLVALLARARQALQVASSAHARQALQKATSVAVISACYSITNSINRKMAQAFLPRVRTARIPVAAL